MTEFALPPGVILILTGLLLPLLPGLLRHAALLAAPLLTLAAVWMVPDGAQMTLSYLGMEIIPVQADKLTRVFATIFAIMGFAGALFALTQERIAELAAAFVYAGAAIGVTFAGDVITLFVFWEIMAIASTIVVAMGARARGASLRYGVIHFFGGVLLMIGIAGHVVTTGSTAMGEIGLTGWPQYLILAAVLLNAGAPPLAAWLPDAYPSASWSGTVFLSAFTTKTSVYVLIRGFPGEEILIWIGLFMVFYGIIMALLENDMRRILAYSIINQVGFMVTAVGIGTPLALDGAAAHAFAHIIYKALLLMSAGAVLKATGRSKCTEVGGLYRYMPVSCICGIIGALAISALPLTSGFTSKSLISSAAGYEHMLFVWLALTAASAGVFFHAGIKFPWFVFFNRKDYLYLHEGTPRDPHWTMQAAMILLSALCIVLGIWYTPLYEMLPNGAMIEGKVYKVWTAPHVLHQLQLLFFSGLAFFLLLDWMKRTPTITLDVDWLWRGLPPIVQSLFGPGLSLWWDRLIDRVDAALSRVLAGLFRTHGPEGTLARTRPTGAMALWMTVLLGAFLLFSFF
ncbi:MAG: Na(+)/H(+) antiporter subunit D [Pseudomonadota bacterium]